MSGALDFADAYDCLHADNHDTAFRCAIALLVVAVPKVALFMPPPLRQRQLKLWTIPPLPLLFAAPDFVDDPWLQHGETSAYAYGLQHRGLVVKAQAQGGLELCCYRCLGAFHTQFIHR